MARHKNQTGIGSKVLLGLTQHLQPPCDRPRGNLLKAARNPKQHKLRTVLSAFTFGVLSNLITTTPGWGAEQIAFYYPPFGEFTLSTRSIELFAKEGKITSEFGFYAQRIKPEQLAQLRELLGKRFNLTPTLVSQFTYSRIGENLLQRMGELLKTEKSQNGFYALRGALILAAADPNGFTIVNVIRRYPSRSIRLNLGGTQEIIGNLADLLKRRDAVVFIVKQTAEAEAANSPKIDFSQQPDLRRAGSFSWQKKNIEMDDKARERRFSIDLYLPQTKTPSSGFPLIVISHGVAENRETFAYVAQHLTSYGFAAAVLEHPGSDAKRFQQYFSGLAGPPEANELINRPLDVKFVLDELQRLSQSDPTIIGQLNLQQVGAIGHSFGGYTTLALAGASIDFEQVRKDCYPNRSLNLSVFLQCRAGELPRGSYPIQDPRIKAVMAINPLSSTILGQKGISQIQVPVMLVGGSQDIVTPAVPEQIRPFTWLSTPNKYLVLIENGTHFSTLDKLDTGEKVLPVPSSLIGPNPAIARPYINALSLAFFQTHLVNRQEYRPYLSASYAQFISQSPLNLSLVQSFSAEMLAPIYDGTYQQSASSSHM